MAVTTQKIQVVDGEGSFHATEVEQFASGIKLPESKTKYQVVAIMGPQSSGKSTLMNHVFGTSFVMMDAMTGRSQTTKGVWLSKAPKVEDILTLVMDLEGSDGRERGDEDTNFERQSALFALAVADVLMVNIWCHDIGREHGAGKPLLKTIFQVNLKLFAPDPSRKKTVLLFVVRDKTKTPLPKLTEVMESDLLKMWDTIAKPPQYKDSKITDFFEIQYAGLSHFEERYEDFLADTVMLRRRFSPDGDETLVRANDHLPGDSFSISVKGIWEVIRSQKDLNLPAHKVMVANIRCAEIRDDQLKNFANDQAWESLQLDASHGLVPGFNKRLFDLVDSCLKGYESEAMYFDSKVRQEKYGELVVKLQELVAPVANGQVQALHSAHMQQLEKEMKSEAVDCAKEGGFANMAARVRKEVLQSFEVAYSKELKIPSTPWDGQAQVEAFQAAVDGHISQVRSSKIAEERSKAERQVSQLVSGPVIGLLDSCEPNLWQQLHAAKRDAVAAAERTLKQALDGFGLTSSEQSQLSSGLEEAGESRLENSVREAALTRTSRMKDRFTELFTPDKQAPRMWGPRDDVSAVASRARLAAANVLAQLAVIHPEQVAAGASSTSRDSYSSVEAAVLRLARADINSEQEPAGTSRDGGEQDADFDISSSATWPGLPDDHVLLRPHEVRTSWREFMSTSKVLVQQAVMQQEQSKIAGKRSLPLWAMVAMLFLGWNEFMAVLWNPIYLILGLVGFLFFRTMYTELDVDSELQRGALPAAISIANKFGPAMKNVTHKTMESLQSFAARVPEEYEAARQFVSEVELNVTPQRHRPHQQDEGGSGAHQHVSAEGLGRRKPAAATADQ